MSDERGEAAHRGPKWWRQVWVEFGGLLLVLFGLILLFGWASERFLRLRTFATIANQIPDLMVVAAGMTLVLIVGGIDLSVGSVMALVGTVMGVLMSDHQWSLAMALPVGLSVGLLCGLANGLVTVVWSIPSFIVTLGMLEMARGMAYLLANSQTKYIGARIELLGAPSWAGLSPAWLLAIVVGVVAQLLLTFTVFGRYAMAIGSNEQAVRYSGIRSAPVKVTAFALCGLLAGLGGIFQSAKLASADPNAGIGFELSAIAAVVIGGTSLMGGRGTVAGSLLGVLIIAVMQSGLAQVGASEPTKRLITGAVIVTAVIADAYRSHWVSFSAGERGERRLL